MNDLLVNKPFASYLIRERIRAGGMSVVYKAYDPRRKQIIALKVLQESLGQHDDIVSRFKQEAEIGKRLSHPYIVTLYDAGEFERRLYIAMPYMANGSLADVITRRPQITLSRSAEIITQIASALDYAHGQNVIHRDLKLGNILLNESGEALLSDFGIARWLDVSRLTLTHEPIPGTTKYMSPEQALGSIEPDHRSDLYSLGVIAYLLTTGRYPFTGINDQVVLNLVLNMEPPRPSQVNPALPPAMDDLLSKALAKNPENRYQSARAFAEDFWQAIREVSTVEVTVDMKAENMAQMVKPDTRLFPDRVPPIVSENGTRTPVFTKPGRSPRREQGSWLLLVIGLALIAVVAGGVIALNQPVFGVPDGGTAIAAGVVTDAPTPTDTLTPSATSTATPTVTPSVTATPTATPTASDTPTPRPPTAATGTIGAIFNPPPSRTPIPSATPTPTLTATRTPTRTSTPTPTPLFASARAARDALLAIRSNSLFDCVRFNETYAFVEREVIRGNPAYRTFAPLLDEEEDPLREIHRDCRNQPDNREYIIPFELFRDMQDVLNALDL